MNWLIPAFLAPALYSVNVFVDKYLLETKVKNYLGMPIYTSIAGFVSGTLAWVFFGFQTLNIFEAIVVVTSGFLSAMALTFYFKALSEEESSSVIILFQMIPVITLSLGFVVLGETVTFKQLLGFSLIIAASLGASLKFGKNQKLFSPVLKFILLYDLFWAVGNILFRFISSETSFFALLPYTGWGFGIGGICLYLFSSPIRKAFLENFFRVGTKVTLVISINEAIFIIARLLSYYAITLASAAALVSVISSTQVFFGVLYGALLTVLFPQIIRENISRGVLIKKAMWGIIAFTGVYLMMF